MDYSKNTEPVVGILYQMISGKSFDLILSAAAVTGKLPIFAGEFIKLVMSYHYYSIIDDKKLVCMHIILIIITTIFIVLSS